MVLEEETSKSEFDGHDDMVQTTCKPSRPPKNVFKIAEKNPKANNSKRKGWGSRLSIGILQT